MRIPLPVPLITFISGVALVAAAVALGQGEVFLFFIFPGVVSGSPLALVGFLLVLLSFVLGFLSLADRLPSAGGPATGLPGLEPPPRPLQGNAESERHRSFGGIIFLGPIPIVFGSGQKVTTIMLVLGLVITGVLVALFFLLR